MYLIEAFSADAYQHFHVMDELIQYLIVFFPVHFVRKLTTEICKSNHLKNTNDLTCNDKWGLSSSVFLSLDSIKVFA